MKSSIYFLLVSFFFLNTVFSQTIPKSYSNIHRNNDGALYLTVRGKQFIANVPKSPLSIAQLSGKPKGTESGLSFDFQMPDFEGIMYYGFINYQDKFPQPVYFHSAAKIKNGKATINIRKKLSGKYDMIHWEEKGFGTLGYRIADAHGKLLYEGRVSFEGTGPFKVIPTVIQGPFVSLLTDHSVTIWFETSLPAEAQIELNGKTYSSSHPDTHHEIHIDHLRPATKYSYSLSVGKIRQTYSFKTAPKPGSRLPFVFGYASDSRGGNGGGERNFFGPNFYMTKKILALAAQKDVAFFQFTGDLVSGYELDKNEMNVQYSNWKKAVEPFAHYFPVIAGMGNHEALIYSFTDEKNRWYSIDRFPYDEQSAEATFAENFVNPTNGPESEDGAYYDPDPNTIDFPSYKENVFYYTYDNVAVVVMNSNYWYAPSLKRHPETSGNLHGYIMDQQLKWVKKTLRKLQNDPTIDHIFVTEHTPFFPNGGHVKDDMWYNGSNEPRAIVAGKPVKQGIIERRDQLLQLIVNETPKVVAILTGDEHNYCRTQIGPDTPLYPENYTHPKIHLTRTVWQINNGAAGAPYYAQEKTPWSDFTHGFTTQNALVLFYVQGKKVKMIVYNPDTLNLVDELQLR